MDKIQVFKSYIKFEIIKIYLDRETYKIGEKCFQLALESVTKWSKWFSLPDFQNELKFIKENLIEIPEKFEFYTDENDGSLSSNKKNNQMKMSQNLGLFLKKIKIFTKYFRLGFIKT